MPWYLGGFNELLKLYTFNDFKNKIGYKSLNLLGIFIIHTGSKLYIDIYIHTFPLIFGEMSLSKLHLDQMFLVSINKLLA